MTAPLITSRAAADAFDITEWKKNAACADVDTSVMFPDDGLIEDDTLKVDYSEAMSVCAPCPVSEMCLAWALDNNIFWGVWGGTTPEQRYAMRTVHDIVPHGTVRGYNKYGCREQCCKDAVTTYYADRRRPLETSDTDQSSDQLAKAR